MSETRNTISRRHLTQETLVVDGLAFNDCTLADCRLIYRGGPPPSIKACRFENCRWEFEDAAAQTLVFLTGLYHGGFGAVVESTFDAVRANARQAPAPTTSAPAISGATSATAARVAEIARRLAETPPIRIVKRQKPKS